jgi:molecular chaperone GrpE (heat shock protein)
MPLPVGGLNSYRFQGEGAHARVRPPLFNQRSPGEYSMENEEKLRLLAQIENMRKSHAAEVHRAYEKGVRDSIAPLFVAADNIKRAIICLGQKGVRKKQAVDGLQSAMGALERDLGQRPLMLQRVQVGPGFQFDPSCMEAISVIPGEAPGLIADEISTGWFRDGILIRAAQVAVYG